MDGQELALPYETPDAPTEGQAGVGEGGAARQPEFDLDALPQFREWKSTMDRQIAAIRQETAAERRQREEYQAELNRIRLAGMDEPERIAWQRDELAKQNQTLQEELKQTRVQMLRQRDFEEISARTGVPAKEIASAFVEGVDDAHTIWAKALDLQAARTQRSAPRQPAQQQQPAPWQLPPQPPAYQQPAPWQVPPGYPAPYPAPYGYQAPYQTAPVAPAQNPANRVDTGIGMPQPSKNRYQDAYKKALENNDASAMLDIQFAAMREGISVGE